MPQGRLGVSRGRWWRWGRAGRLVAGEARCPAVGVGSALVLTAGQRPQPELSRLALTQEGEGTATGGTPRGQAEDSLLCAPPAAHLPGLSRLHGATEREAPGPRAPLLSPRRPPPQVLVSGHRSTPPFFPSVLRPSRGRPGADLGPWGPPCPHLGTGATCGLRPLSWPPCSPAGRGWGSSGPLGGRPAVVGAGIPSGPWPGRCLLPAAAPPLTRGQEFLRSFPRPPGRGLLWEGPEHCRREGEGGRGSGGDGGGGARVPA